MGFPYRVAAIATGAAMLAEAEGVDALWYPDHLMAWHPRALWREAGGVLAEVVDDPHAYADPFVAATVALMATRRPRVGIAVTDTYRRHPATIAQAAATLGELAPGRFVLGLGSGEGLNTAPLGIERTRPVAPARRGARDHHPAARHRRPGLVRGRALHARPPARAWPTPVRRRATGRDRPRRALRRAARPRRPLRHRLAAGPADHGRRATRSGSRSRTRRGGAAGRDPDAIVPGPLPLRGDPRGPRRRGEGARRGAAAHAGARGELGAVRPQPGSSTRSVPASRVCATTSPSGCPPRRVRDAANDLPADAAQHFVVHGTPAEIVAQLQPFVDVGRAPGRARQPAAARHPRGARRRQPGDPRRDPRRRGSRSGAPS